MAQYNPGDFGLASDISGIGLVGLLASWAAALQSSHAGSTRPAWLAEGAVWYDTDTDDIKLYNGVTDLILLSTSNGLLKSNNLSDVASAATAFSNIKQAATDTATGVVELATTAEAAAGTDTTRAVTPEGVEAFYDGKILQSSSALDFGSVPATGGALEATIGVTGAASGDLAFIDHVTALNDGLVTTCLGGTGTNLVTIRLTNATAGAINPTAKTFYVCVLKR